MMIVLSDEYHASYTVNIHCVIPSLRRQTLEKHHQLSPYQIDRVRPLGEFNLTEAILKADFCFQNKFNLTGCAPLGEFNLTEAILKADFCFQINLTGSAQIRTSQKGVGKFQFAAPQNRNRIRNSIFDFARERTCRQTMSSYKTQISTIEIDFV